MNVKDIHGVFIKAISLSKNRFGGVWFEWHNLKYKFYWQGHSLLATSSDSLLLTWNNNEKRRFKRNLSVGFIYKDVRNFLLQLKSFFHALILILTCQSRKSLRRTSPEVRMSRSGLGELLLYKHSLSSSSETSLSTTGRHKRRSLKQQLPGLSFFSTLQCITYVGHALSIKAVFTLLWLDLVPLPRPFL